jgi:hypothetical protein
VELERDHAPVGVGRLVDVALLAGPDLAADGRDGAARGERAEREEVVAERRQPVPLIFARVVVDELVAEERAEALARAAVAEARDRLDERGGDDLVLLVWGEWVGECWWVGEVGGCASARGRSRTAAAAGGRRPLGARSSGPSPRR